MAGATVAPYSVIDVRGEWPPDWNVADDEVMGIKPKFWFEKLDDQKIWLFKYPVRRETGEHWAEKIASEVAGLIGVPHARVELATFENTPDERAARFGYKGSVTKSFMQDDDTLIHGNQILPLVVPDYNTQEKRFRQSQHTLYNIWLALDYVFKNSEESMAAKAQFAGYLTLDALVGNTDRHNENWGLLAKDDGSGARIAPSYDHASCLGRELQDVRRRLLLSEERVGKYAAGTSGKRGRGGSTGQAIRLRQAYLILSEWRLRLTHRRLIRRGCTCRM